MLTAPGITASTDWWETWDLNYVDKVFGALESGGSVEVALQRTLKLWFPSYVNAINRHIGLPILKVPVDYNYQPDERPIAAGVAQLMVAAPKTQGNPVRYNAGGEQAGQGARTRETFLAQVTVFFGGTQNYNESRAIAQAYAAAIKGAIGQHPGLPDKDGVAVAETTNYLGYSTGVEERSSSFFRTRTAVLFGVTLGNTLDVFGGPSAPAVGTPADPSEVTEYHVKVVQE